MFGILLLNKPSGLTSHDVVNHVRRTLHTKRVGHAGTLDPLATGVLVIAVGPATRFLQYLPLEPKVYEATIQFGTSTETFDSEGAPTASAPVPNNLAELLEHLRPSFTGLVRQLPPMFSAVKYKGKALYKYARAGETVEREPRTIHVSELSFEAVGKGVVHSRIVCSGGTYIRTLAHDLGQSVGCGAHLSALVRTSVGKFQLNQCVEVSSVSPSDLLPLSHALPPMPLIQLDAQQTCHLREGRSVKIECSPSNSMVGLIEPGGDVFSVARLFGTLLQPECVVPQGAILDAV